MDQALSRITRWLPIRTAAAILAVASILPATAQSQPTQPSKITAASCEAFGFDFYRELVHTPAYEAKSDKNVALSPLSLTSVLEVLRLGTVRETHSELAAALHSSDSVTASEPSIADPKQLASEGVTLSIGNSLWIGKNFDLKPGFLHSVDAAFGSIIFKLDFTAAQQAVDRVNGWISDHTAGHIKDLLTPGDVSKDTKLIVANAVYFKGKWKTPFDAKVTHSSEFHLASGKDVEVSMMHRKADFGFAEVDGVKVLELPYAGKTTSMVLLLPASGSEAMAHLENLLRGNWLRDTVKSLPSVEVNVALPKFTFTCEPQTVPVLQALGIRKLFEPGRDFEAMSDMPGLCVSRFKHRAWLEVSEEGTEAAAATVAVITKMSMPVDSNQFVADHPFLFVIRHNATGTPLFIGRVSNPASK